MIPKSRLIGRNLSILIERADGDEALLEIIAALRHYGMVVPADLIMEGV